MDDCQIDTYAVSPIDEGFNILARIIARDFMAKQTVNGDYINDCSNNRDIPDERSLP